MKQRENFDNVKLRYNFEHMNRNIGSEKWKDTILSHASNGTYSML